MRAKILCQSEWQLKKKTIGVLISLGCGVKTAPRNEVTKKDWQHLETRRTEVSARARSIFSCFRIPLHFCSSSFLFFFLSSSCVSSRRRISTTRYINMERINFYNFIAQHTINTGYSLPPPIFVRIFRFSLVMRACAVFVTSTNLFL